MQDPIQRHPTRGEQLDILVSAIDAICADEDYVLDLGCGTGYVDELLLERRNALNITGVDLSAGSLESARNTLAGYGARFSGIQSDLGNIDGLDLPTNHFQAVFTCLTFHDLSHDAKQAVIEWVAKRLRPNGVFFLYDCLRLTQPNLFPVQTAVWSRLERMHSQGMRSAPTFTEYEADLGPNNNPAALAEYFRWFQEAGLTATCIHVHGNIALLAGAH